MTYIALRQKYFLVFLKAQFNGYSKFWKIDILLKLFTENCLKANPEKYAVMLSTNDKPSLNLRNLSISTWN